MSGSDSPAGLAIERFIKTSLKPALLEPGEDLLPLGRDNFAMEFRSGFLTLQAWDDSRNIVRRITGIHDERPGKLELLVERFGKRVGTVILLDTARPSSQPIARRGVRLSFREQLRRYLRRQFVGWTIAELSTELNLEQSLSPAYPRALLTRGRSGWAVIGASAEAADPSGALSFGLIWLDYLRRRERRITIEGLALFLPAGQERATCLRLKYLNGQVARYRVFVYLKDGYEDQIDPSDHGNLATKLETCRPCIQISGTELAAGLEQICQLDSVERVERNDGIVSLRVRGLEFARITPDRVLYGLETKHLARASNLLEIERLARELARMRSPIGGASNKLSQMSPELWLESQVRANVETVDATLLPHPIYGQVPAFAGGERGVIDMLAADRNGRLTVLELKASEDIQLPMQALDYWMRVKWHADRGEFSPRGYFAGMNLSVESPRLLLIAPALSFHPANEVVLRYFSSTIEVERIGLGMEWKSSLKPVFRLCGGQTPV